MVTSILPLHVDALEIHRRGQCILGPIDLRFEGPSITALLGDNGAGKTTLLRALHGLERSNGGTITWATPQEDARKHQSFVFQRPTLLRRSVIDNVAYPLLLRGFSSANANEKAVQLLTEVGLDTHLKQRAITLSGGEQQKLALARALITQPEMLFLDEPCANLDQHSTRVIEDMVLKLPAKGVCVLIATHNIRQAKRIADMYIRLSDGAITDAGPIASLDVSDDI